MPTAIHWACFMDVTLLASRGKNVENPVPMENIWATY
jgi:hypothetical protein